MSVESRTTVSGPCPFRRASRNAEETESDLWTMPADGSAEAVPFLQTAADENRPRFSPDGRFVAYHSDESGRDEIYVKPFPSGEGKWQVSVNGGRIPVWSRDGERLYYISNGTIQRVQVTTESGLTLSTPEMVLEAGGPGGGSPLGRARSRFDGGARALHRGPARRGRRGRAGSTWHLRRGKLAGRVHRLTPP